MTGASEQGRALAALRRRTTVRCEVCGATFEAWDRKTQQARTCSGACRAKLHRQEVKERAMSDFWGTIGDGPPVPWPDPKFTSKPSLHTWMGRQGGPMTPEQRYYANSDEGEIKRLREQVRIATEALEHIVEFESPRPETVANDALIQMSVVE
jgi:hypothetical protein